MKKAFISYRRQDIPGHVRAIHDRLRLHFHPDQIFMDVEDIPLGQDFVAVLDNNLRDCVVMIVMIGPGWLDIRQNDGSRRLDNPNDFVRLEISQALHNGMSIIPILVDGALMPTEDELPDALKPLARRQALELDNKHYDYGIRTLTTELEKLLGAPAAQPEPEPPPAPSNRMPLILGGVVALCLFGAAMYWLLSKPENPANNQNPHNGINTENQNTQTIPTAAAGFDCSKASNDAEDAICNSDLTRRSDKRLNQVYQQLFERLPPAAQERLHKRQMGWVQQRNQHIRQNCFTQANQALITNCIHNYYQQRISTLSRQPVNLFSQVQTTDPPTNIRLEPNGEVVCQVQEKKMIEVYTDAVRERDGDNWYPTKVCGDSRWGLVHESQISRVH